MNIVILILASVGFAVSLYAYLVEKKMRLNSAYRPACDITKKISCSRAFNSQYAKLLGVTNTVVGMVFYALILVAELFQFGALVYYYAIAGVVASVVFAYLLYVKIGTFCLVCTMIYIVNISLLIASMRG